MVMEVQWLGDVDDMSVITASSYLTTLSSAGTDPGFTKWGSISDVKRVLWRLSCSGGARNLSLGGCSLLPFTPPSSFPFPSPPIPCLVPSLPFPLSPFPFPPPSLPWLSFPSSLLFSFLLILLPSPKQKQQDNLQYKNNSCSLATIGPTSLKHYHKCAHLSSSSEHFRWELSTQKAQPKTCYMLQNNC